MSPPHKNNKIYKLIQPDFTYVSDNILCDISNGEYHMNHTNTTVIVQTPQKHIQNKTNEKPGTIIIPLINNHLKKQNNNNNNKYSFQPAPTLDLPYIYKMEAKHSPVVECLSD